MIVTFLVVACQDAEEEAGIDSETPAATPTVTQASTPAATAATPSPAPTPPVADAKAPDGCLEGEKAYVDADGYFAFCYMEDMEVATVATPDCTAVTVRHPIEDDNRVVVNWGKVSEPRVGVVDIAPCIDSPHIIKNRRLRPFTIADTTVEACFQDHFDSQDPKKLLYSSIDLEIPAFDGGAIQVGIALSGPDFARDGVPTSDLADRLAASAVVEMDAN